MTGKKNAYNMRLTIKEREESMATGKALDGKPYAGNPHVRFDEGEVAPATTPRRGSLLYRSLLLSCAVGLAAAVSAFADEVPWTYDTSKRVETPPQSAVSTVAMPLVARNVIAAESDAASELDAWVYSFALLLGLNVDASPLGITITIR